MTEGFIIYNFFFSNTSKRIMLVVQIDDYNIENGKPGALTLQLSELLKKGLQNKSMQM